MKAANSSILSQIITPSVLSVEPQTTPEESTIPGGLVGLAHPTQVAGRPITIKNVPAAPVKLRQTAYHKPSDDPVRLIDSLPRHPNQPYELRRYQSGWEQFFGELPVLKAGDPLLDLHTATASAVLTELAKQLVEQQDRADNPLRFGPVAPGKFERAILGVEAPVYAPNAPSYGNGELLREGAEVLVAFWGEGFTSPVHGHADGLLHEQVLTGLMRVNQYRIVAEGRVRPVRTDIHGPGLIVSKFSPPDERGKRVGVPHNFTAVEATATLHYVPEHTRDGRDNRLLVEEFPLQREDVIETTVSDVIAKNRIGEVYLVRSETVKEYGDHYIVITGGNVVKSYGLRPQEVAIHVSGVGAGWLLNEYKPTLGVVVLKLNEEATARFLEFHAITVEGNNVKFPEA